MTDDGPGEQVVLSGFFTQGVQKDAALGVAGENQGAPGVEQRLESQQELGRSDGKHFVGSHDVLLVLLQRFRPRIG